MAKAARGPLAGVRVLELSQIMSGPTCGLMLADLGADVIKVEKLPGGDDVRAYKDPQINGVAAPFLMLNRDKRSIAMNFKKTDGKAAFLRMVQQADVVLENFRPGTMEKLGLGSDVLLAHNPGLIYCAISGYGRTGPMAAMPGFDLVAQGFAGLMSITGEPNRPPVKTGNSVADMNAGLLACIGIVSAYVEKLKSGRGQVVDTSLMEAALQQTYWHAAIYFASGINPQPTGSAHVLAAPYQACRTADGWVNIGGANQNSWENIAKALGHSEWIEDARFLTGPLRQQNRMVLIELMERELVQKNTEFWVAKFDSLGIPAGPVHTIGQAMAHPQTLAREMVIDLVHPQAGPTKNIGMPIKFSAYPSASLAHPQTHAPAPALGQHSEQILGEFGFSADETTSLLSSGAVQ